MQDTNQEECKDPNHNHHTNNQSNLNQSSTTHNNNLDHNEPGPRMHSFMTKRRSAFTKPAPNVDIASIEPKESTANNMAAMGDPLLMIPQRQ